LERHLEKCYAPLLEVPWVLDVDTTVKVLYPHQEGAVVGYNPKKPGRPSHTYHTYSLANICLILDVEVQPGNQMAAKYMAPDLWSLLERIPSPYWTQFIRSDCAFGTDGVMNTAEEKGVPYLFKLKLTKNIKRLIERLMLNQEWVSAGQIWEGQESVIQLQGWDKSRRVIIIYKRVNKEFLAEPNKHLEAITSRPLLLNAIGKQTTHAGQIFIKITSTHGRIKTVRWFLGRTAAFKSDGSIYFSNRLKTI
jgi:hypothetical protein